MCCLKRKHSHANSVSPPCCYYKNQQHSKGWAAHPRPGSTIVSPLFLLKAATTAVHHQKRKPRRQRKRQKVDHCYSITRYDYCFCEIDYQYSITAKLASIIPSNWRGFKKERNIPTNPPPDRNGGKCKCKGGTPPFSSASCGFCGQQHWRSQSNT